MKHWTDNIKKKECNHEWHGQSIIKDFTYANTGKHLYCPECRCHWWQDRFWTAKEWDDYVNDGEISYCSCCGAKNTDGCYSDCIWYKGKKNKDKNPH